MAAEAEGEVAGGGADAPFSPALLADLGLAAGDENRFELASNVSGRLAYVSEGDRVRAVDLARRAFAESTFDDGVLYCLDPNDDLFGVIVPDVGKIRTIRQYPVGATPPSGLPTGMTWNWNPTAGSCFVVDNYAPAGLTSLLSYDAEAGTRSQIGLSGLGGTLRMYSLARHPTDGHLYTVEVADDLYRLHPGTGAATQLGPTGRTDIQSLSFSPGGTLYGIHTLNPPELVTVNTTTGAASRVGDLPLGTEIGCLAFQPDGRLWTVDLTFDRLLELSPSDGSVLQAFDTLKVPKTWGDGYYFLAINALTWCPERTTMAWEEDTEMTVDSLAVVNDGRVLASSMSRMGGLDRQLYRDGDPLTFLVEIVGLEDTVYDATTDRAYARDSLSGTLYEIAAATQDLLREIDYRDAQSMVSKSASV